MVASTKVVNTGDREKWVDSRDIWEVKTIGLGDFLNVKKEKEVERGCLNL